MLIMTKCSPQPCHKSLHTFNNKEPKCLFKHFYSIHQVSNSFQIAETGFSIHPLSLLCEGVIWPMGLWENTAPQKVHPVLLRHRL